MAIFPKGSNAFTAGESALWVQPRGSNTEPLYLGCHNLDDVERPRGDLEPRYCPDPANFGDFLITGSIRSAPDFPSTTITAPIGPTCDYLETLDSGANIYVVKNYQGQGRRDVFNNWKRIFIFAGIDISSETYTGLAVASQDDNDQSTQDYEIIMQDLLKGFELESERQTTTSTTNVNDVKFCDAACQEGFKITDAGAGVSAIVYKTSSGGSTWTATGADPFGADEHLLGLSCFDLGKNLTRVMVGRGVTDVGNPPEIAYSDDDGDTWVTVNVGSDNGEFITSTNALFSLDWTHTWVGVTGGEIYFSGDGGASWGNQNTTALATNDITAISFFDVDTGWAGGVTNTILKTITGGSTWELVTGPAAEAANDVTSISTPTSDRVWVSYSSGRLYYSEDGGSTWTEASFSGSGVGSIAKIEFYNEYAGIIVRNTAAPIGNVLRTIDGGYNWQAESSVTVSNDGFNSSYMCNINDFFIAGNVVDAGTGFIGKSFGCRT